MDDTIRQPKLLVNVPENIPVVESSCCHSIPCEIQYNGEAPVSTYFKVRQDEVSENDSASQSLRSSFRGRPLKGQQIVLPDGYEAVVLADDEVSFNDVEVKEMEVQKRFNGFTLWNWDQNPTSDDKTIRAMNDWLAVSEALHGPIAQ